MRIGLYGMPSAGKSFILENIDFIDVFCGSQLLKKRNPDFDIKNSEEKNTCRKELARYLLTKNDFIMDGHYSFGDEIAFTEADGNLYDTFIYLYIEPEILRKRMERSDKNQKYLEYDVSLWQKKEIDRLREYCHQNNKDFYVVDNPSAGYFEDIQIVTDFIKDVVKGFSCVSFAEKCANDILSHIKEEKTVTLFDGDRTFINEDSSSVVFDYKTDLFDGNFYTGFQSWRQQKDFQHYGKNIAFDFKVTINERIINNINNTSFILTSGHPAVWDFIANKSGLHCFSGDEISAETKLYVVKHLHNAGKEVRAYGDSMSDYYMLIQADKGFLMRKQDGNISKSLSNKELGGLIFV